MRFMPRRTPGADKRGRKASPAPRKSKPASKRSPASAPSIEAALPTGIDVPIGHERRSSRRLSLNLDVAVPVLVRGPDGLLHGVARNISEGGMLIELAELPGIGARLEITIMGVAGSADAPDGVTLVGEVRHQLAWQHAVQGRARLLKGVGVRFLEPAEIEEPSVPTFDPNVTYH
jgi:hypothetical protein